MANVKKEDRLFNPYGRRHYRRTYNINEVRIGAVIVIILLSIAGWVAWRGMNPDPSLFSIEVTYNTDSVTKPRKKIADGWPAALPKSLNFDAWHTTEPNVYNSDNLYEKINGREGFYKSFGFSKTV